MRYFDLSTTNTVCRPYLEPHHGVIVYCVIAEDHVASLLQCLYIYVQGMTTMEENDREMPISLLVTHTPVLHC